MMIDGFGTLNERNDEPERGRAVERARKNKRGVWGVISMGSDGMIMIFDEEAHQGING